jgi:hypothetical protein
MRTMNGRRRIDGVRCYSAGTTVSDLLNTWFTTEQRPLVGGEPDLGGALCLRWNHYAVQEGEIIRLEPVSRFLELRDRLLDQNAKVRMAPISPFQSELFGGWL